MTDEALEEIRVTARSRKIIQLPVQPRYRPMCRGCGCRWDQHHPSHEYCARCYRGAQLYRAIARYRESRR